MRILTNTDYSVELPVFVGQDRETAADPSVVTCGVTREDGTSLGTIVVTSGDIDGTTDLGHFYGRLTAASGHTTQVDNLSLTSAGSSGGNTQTYTTQVEVVGAHYVTVPEMRAYPGMSSTSDFPRALLEDVRDDLEDYIERVTGLAFVPRYHRDRFDGTWDRNMFLSKQNIRRILSVKVNGIAQTTANFDAVKDPRWENNSMVTWRTNWFPAATISTGRNNISIAYEYGSDAPPPRLKRELLKAIKSEASSQNSNESFRAISETIDGRIYRYSTPNRLQGRPLGEITLDAVLDEYTDRWVAN